MSYEVLARKWRPRQFDQVVGQDHVVQTLKNAIESGRLAHAYLFVGPRGIGKTSIARIFAKSLNCTTGPTVTPCDNCDSCREVAAGTSMDVLEIDGASNNGVEQVRDLRETVKYAPTQGKFKIYIIDEVHMLSVAAFNALLKTLEEPPPHVKFMFATTEPEKVLATIVSRCQRFDLRRIPVNLIVERLELIAKDEGVEIDNDALLAIARGAEGGLRDAESAMDQLISFRGKKITESDVLSVFGLVSRAALEDLAGKILRGDVKSVIHIVTELDRAGKDLQRLVVELMEHFRNLLVCMHVQEGLDGVDLTPPQVAVLREQAKGTDAGKLLRITDILTQAEGRMRYALSRRTLLETVLIRCARTAVVVSLEEILEQINILRGQSPAGSGSKKKPLNDQPARASVPEPVVVAGESVQEDGGKAIAISDLKDHWREIVDKIGELAPLARTVLLDAIPSAVNENSVLISFDPEFAGELESFHSGRNRKAVERTLMVYLGRHVDVAFKVSDEVLERKEKPVSSEEPAEPVEREPEKPAEAEDVSGESKSSRPVAEWAREKPVAKVLDMFNGTITGVRK